MFLKDMCLGEFAREVASPSPAPGGGSVAAYAGVQGYALVAMVCRLTIGRDKFSSVEKELEVLLEQAEVRLERLLCLVDEDTQGFNIVMEALKSPRNTEAEKLRRSEALEKATLEAAQIPLETAQLCLVGLGEIPDLLLKANSNALSDMGVAGMMFRAGLEGALFNVEINASALKSLEKGKTLKARVQRMREEGQNLMGQIQAYLSEHL